MRSSTSIGRQRGDGYSAVWEASRKEAAFTLIEMMVVIAIIGLLAAIGLPAMRGMTRSNALIASNRQFSDDLAYARQRAIADHTYVFVLFVPTNIASYASSPLPVVNTQLTNLLKGPFTTYALLSLRQLGEQPGRATPRYLTSWRTMPNGVYIALSKYINNPQTGVRPFPYAAGFPFPVATNYPPLTLMFPYLAFNYEGQLVTNSSPNINVGQLLPDRDEYIPLARGSIFFDPVTAAPDVQENPAGNSVMNIPNSLSNVVYINALTGRTKVLQQSIQ
jgi:prepilin-type N-terminal cleavage/methylation domain-containing protein